MNFFTAGPLLIHETRQKIWGIEPKFEPARLRNYHMFSLENGDFEGLAECGWSTLCYGFLFHSLCKESMDATAVFYGNHHRIQEVTVETRNGIARVFTLVHKEEYVASRVLKKWRLDHYAKRNNPNALSDNPFVAMDPKLAYSGS